jgi:hypothetical protein
VAAARKPFLLRLPPDLYEDLERWAADELRSVNAQIEYLLREQVRKRKGARADDESGGEGEGR